MSRHHPAPAWRTWSAGLGSLAVVATSAPRIPTLVEQVGDDAFPVALTALAHLTLLAVAGWLAVVVGLDSVGGVPRRLARRLTPRWAQGLLLASVGTLATVVPAHADPGTLDGLQLPDRPAISSPTSSSPDPAPPSTATERHRTAAKSTAATGGVTVRPGDTLWAIAAHRLGPGADAAEVARAVEQWHAANREVIGSDPDVIRPGQVLAAPGESR